MASGLNEHRTLKLPWVGLKPMELCSLAENSNTKILAKIVNQFQSSLILPSKGTKAAKQAEVKVN